MFADNTFHKQCRYSSLRSGGFISLLYVLIAIPMLLFVANASAMKNNNTYRFIGDLGLGGSTSNTFSGSGFIKEITVIRNSNFISLRNLDQYNGDNIFTCFFKTLLMVGCHGLTKEFREEALLVGREFGNHHIQVAVGSSMTENANATSSTDMSVTGIAFDVRKSFLLSHASAVGLMFSGAFGGSKSFAGIYLTFELGMF